MLLHEKEIHIPSAKGKDLIAHFNEEVQDRLPSGEIPIRFVVTRSDTSGYHCELGTLKGLEDYPCGEVRSIFDFVPRPQLLP